MKTNRLTYALFVVVFCLVIVGILLHSVVWLAVLAVAAVLLATVADRLENQLTETHRRDNKRESNS